MTTFTASGVGRLVVSIIAVWSTSFACADAQAAPGIPAAAATPFAQPIGAGELPGEPTIAQAADYRIRQGDDVTVVVFGEAALSPNTPIRVLPGGNISMPLAGSVRIAGLTTEAAGRAVAQKLRAYLRNPRVTVAVARVGLVEALLLGNFKTPGKYTLSAPTRLTDAIAAAGGLGAIDGDLPDARLQLPDGAVRTVSLQKLLHDGDTSLNVAIASGETIYVASPVLFNVRVIGAVDKPGDVQLHEGDDLAMAIARAGTSQNSAVDLNHVVVTRTDATGKTTAQEVNLYEILKSGNLAHDVRMQKNDLVYVPQAGRRDGQRGFDPLGILRRFVGF